MELQNYIRLHGLEKTCEDLKILHKRHNIYPQLVTMKYDMIESDFSKIEVCQARGIILDENDDWNVVARAYDKFFNHGEGRAAKINWQTAKVLEKLDGSLCLLYWNKYANAWDVGTQGTPDASGPVNGFTATFANLFWETFHSLGYKLPDNKSCTYIFELMRVENRIVVRHEKPRLVLHGIRYLEQIYGYPEYQYNALLTVGINNDWEVVQVYSLNTIEAIIESCAAIDPLKNEGYVVCDDKFNRIKVKSPQYLALHSMKDGFGPRRVVEMIRFNESEEWLAYFPEFKELHDKYRAKYDALLNVLETAWVANKNIESQKDFALAIKDVPCSGALFQLRRGTIKTFKEYLAGMIIKNLVDYLEK